MTEERRQRRNRQRLQECYPSFAARIRRVLADLERMGFRPRIQDAWRSPAKQLEAYQAGHSKLKFGFHNVTGDNGKPEAFAVEIFDDNHPLNPPKRFLLALAATAENYELETGIRWGLPRSLRGAIDRAIAPGDFEAPVKIGWDPCHVQPAYITLAEVKRGVRV